MKANSAALLTQVTHIVPTDRRQHENAALVRLEHLTQANTYENAITLQRIRT